MTRFLPTTSKINLWTLLDRLPRFSNFVEYFSGFVFIKLIVDLIVMVLRYVEVHHLTGATTLLSTPYNLFLTSVLILVFNPQAPLLQALEPESIPARPEDETRDPVDGKKEKGRTPLPECSSPRYGSFPCLTSIRITLYLTAAFFIQFFSCSLLNFRRPTVSLAWSRRTLFAAEQNWLGSTFVSAWFSFTKALSYYHSSLSSFFSFLCCCRIGSATKPVSRQFLPIVNR